MNTPPTLLYLQFRPCSFPAFWTFPDVRGSRCCCGCSDLSPRCPAQSQQVSECSVPIWLCQSGLIRKAPVIYLKFRCVRKETEAEQNNPPTPFLAAFWLVLFCFQQAKSTVHGRVTELHPTPPPPLFVSGEQPVLALFPLPPTWDTKSSAQKPTLHSPHCNAYTKIPTTEHQEARLRTLGSATWSSPVHRWCM